MTTARGLVERYARPLLWLAIIIFAVPHLVRLAEPPNGYHAWRESDTAAVILNYYQEDMNPLHPRINQRGASSGITGMEFPLYNYAAAVGYSAFGPSHTIPKGITFLAAILAILTWYRVVRDATTTSTAILAAWALAFSPLVYFYSFKIMPDILMLALWIGALRGYQVYDATKRRSSWLWSLVLLTLSALIKPLTLSLYLPLLLLELHRSRRSRERLLRWGGYVVLSFVSVAAWFMFAYWLNERYQTPGFYLGENLPNFHQFLLTTQFVKKLFLQWPFELWVGWALLPAAVLGIAPLMRSGLSKLWLGWIISIYIVFAMTAQHSASHDYYTLLMVPPLALVAGMGLNWLLERSRATALLALLLLLAAPLAAHLRISHRHGSTEIFHAVRHDSERLIDRDDLVAVEDRTTAIRLYRMNRHGWPLRNEIDSSAIAPLIEQGLDWLVIEQPIEEYDSSLLHLVTLPPDSIGPLLGYRIRQSD